MAPGVTGEPRAPCRPLIVEPAAFPQSAARRIAEAIELAASRRELVSLALSGGKTPAPVYRTLAAMSGLPWSRVQVYFADERAVPPESSESNFRLVRESLLDRLPVPPASVRRMEAESPDLAHAAEDYSEALPATLDVLVLGMGEDGHTASLFPGHPAVREERRTVLAVEGPVPPRRRLTITPPVFRSARACFMLVAGLAKAEAVARACQGRFDPLACPAQLARGGEWIVDQPAASRLRP